MIILYLGLLLGGVGLFVLSYAAQFRLAALLRQRHPQQWRIIAEPEHGKASAWRTWIRLQHALRSPAMPRHAQRLATSVALQPVAGLAVLAGCTGDAHAAALKPTGEPTCNWT